MTLQAQVVPEKAVVVRREKTIIAASWFGPNVMRPYVYPFLGPHDRELTRLGHPLDPVGHSHHRSLWIGHHDVAGVDFWGESRQSGRINQEGVELIEKTGNRVRFRLECRWQAPGGRTLLDEDRTLTFFDLGRGELALEIESVLRPPKEAGTVVLGDTPFGLLGVRVARTVRVHENLGGLILNSNEGENEAGCFWQHAEWCDYSGPVPLAGTSGKSPPRDTLPGVILGIACYDHPANSPGDTTWHVRDDGWMGPCISKGAPRRLAAGERLRVRYRLEAHAGRPWHAGVPERYRAWRSATKE